MPDIRGPWLDELREDVVNATLVTLGESPSKPVALNMSDQPIYRAGH